MKRLALFAAVSLFLVALFPGESAQVPQLHIHFDVVASTNLHRESLPIADIHVALGNSPITATQTSLAVRLALKRWGGTRCAGPIRLLRAHLLPLNIIAQAEWSTGFRPRVYLDCSVTFNSSRANLTFRFYCAIISHEYGHLAGFYVKGGLDSGTHSRNPYAVMYPILSSKNIPLYCKR